MKKYLFLFVLLLGLPLVAVSYADPPVAPQTPVSASISDTAYNEGTWDGVTTTAPSKNAVRDKIETLCGITEVPLDSDFGSNGIMKRTGAGTYGIAVDGTDYLASTRIDDTKGNGDTGYVWSADKVFDQLALKIGAAGVTYENLSASGDIGTEATQVSQGDHAHDGRYYTETEVDTWRNSTTQTEMGYVHGVTSDIQTQLGTKIGSAGVTYENLSANSDIGTGAVQVAQGDHTHGDIYYTETEIDTWRNSTTQTEMGYLHGVTSDIQTQLDAIGGGDSNIYVNNANGNPNVNDTAYAVDGGVTQSTWESVGPTDEGSPDNTWAALDDVPSGVDWIKVMVVYYVREASGTPGLNELISVRARENSGEETPGADQYIAYDVGSVTEGDDCYLGGAPTRKIPVDANKIFDIFWFTTCSTSQSVDLFLVGYGYDDTGGGGGGSGDVTGPGSATADAICLFDGTEGKTIKDSTRTIVDTMDGVGDTIPDEAAIKTYGDANWGSGAVGTSGTPIADDIAQFTDDNTIKGMTYAELAAIAGFETALEAVLDISDLQGYGTAASRAAADDLNTDSALPDSAAIKTYGDANWGGGSGMTYPDAGIALSTGVAWTTSITNNSSNWNTAYDDRLKWDGGSTGLTAATGRTSLGLGSAALRAAEDSLTDGSNLPDGAAIKAYGDANWGGGSSEWTDAGAYIYGTDEGGMVRIYDAGGLVLNSDPTNDSAPLIDGTGVLTKWGFANEVTESGRRLLILDGDDEDETLTPAVWIEKRMASNDTTPASDPTLPVGLYVAHENSGSNEFYTHSIMGYALNNGTGDNDVVGVSGRVRKKGAGVGDACGVWGSAYADVNQNGGVMGLEASIFQNADGDEDGGDAWQEKMSMGLHIYGASTTENAFAAIAMDVNHGDDYGFWNGILLDQSLWWDGGAYAQGIAGTVGINMGSFDISKGWPQHGIKLGYGGITGTDAAEETAQIYCGNANLKIASYYEQFYFIDTQGNGGDSFHWMGGTTPQTSGDLMRLDTDGDLFVKGDISTNSGTTYLADTGDDNEDSGAHLVGVYGELTNSVGTRVQKVLKDFDDAITNGASQWTDDGAYIHPTNATAGGLNDFRINDTHASYSGTEDTALYFKTTTTAGDDAIWAYRFELQPTAAFGGNTVPLFSYNNYETNAGTLNNETAFGFWAFMKGPASSTAPRNIVGAEINVAERENTGEYYINTRTGFKSSTILQIVPEAGGTTYNVDFGVLIEEQAADARVYNGYTVGYESLVNGSTNVANGTTSTDGGIAFLARGDGTASEAGSPYAVMQAKDNWSMGIDLHTATFNKEGIGIWLGDAQEARFGTATDYMVVEHVDGVGSTNRIYGGYPYYIKNETNDEQMASFTPNGADTFYYDGSKKLETTNTGITVTGSCSGCDYVFEDDYKLMSLDDLQKFVDDNEHLPGLTIARGTKIEFDTMRRELVEKIEEQSLYILQLNERISRLEKGGQENENFKVGSSGRYDSIFDIFSRVLRKAA